jgi:hypothetical protein
MILLEVQLVEFYWVVHHKQYNKGLFENSNAQVVVLKHLLSALWHMTV